MFRDLVPAAIATGEGDPRALAPALLSGEQPFGSRVVEKRRREFAAGRHLARRAMAGLGVEPVAIPAGDDRAPVWPRGLVGSISHCDDWCVAAVGRRDDGFAAIGVDIEPAGPLDDDLFDIVFTERERDWLEARPSAERGRLGRAIFSAKESAYKCQYPLTGELIDFQAFEIALAAGAFHATFTTDVGRFPAGSRLEGRIAISAAYIASAVALPTFAA